MKKIISWVFLIFIFLISLGFSDIVKAAQNYPHWNKSPINVYIPKNEKNAIVRKAFERWQDSSFNKLHFNFVQKGPADIDVVFAEKVDGSDASIGSYKTTEKGVYITKAEIQLATKGSKKYSDNLIYATALHEIGHVLGLSHNERTEMSVMHLPVTESKDIIRFDLIKLYKVNGWSWKNHRDN